MSATTATTAATATTTAVNAAIAAARGAARAPSPRTGPLGVALALLVFVGILWLTFRLYLAGEPLVAMGVLLFGSIAVVLYSNATTLAWRYLFPGVAGMLLFVAFPLLYTVGIGFTNYSSANLLEFERARAYLLAQFTVDEAHAYDSSLHAAPGGGVQLVLRSRSSGQAFTAGPQLPAAAGPAAPGASAAPGAPGTPGATGATGATGAGAAALPLQPLSADPGPALDLRQTIAQRDRLMGLQLLAPDGQTLQYAGLREFAPLQPVWKAHADGSLTQLATGAVYRPNGATGFFETAAGERVSPGYRVGIGWANYSRMLFDPDFRGPFVQIFLWTVVFAGLSVVLAGGLGLTLAVMLNWEALPHRTLYRTLLFLPYAVPGFISILVFKGLFNQNFGEINAILHALFGVRPAWFADPLLAKAMLLIVNTWLGFPYFMILCAGLIKAIPSDLYEASALAGAKPLDNFLRITAPLILKPLTPLLISAYAFNFNNFVLIALLTDGRPDFLNTKLPAGTTDILVSYTYRIAFTDSGQNFGLAAAISTLIFILVALMALLQLKMTKQGAKA
ncbi:MAG: maltose ABC transporter permease MalF [Rubrivivax sp.]|nr:maltose ABC transporter permease MalF [Rubrivivax sp.]